MNEIEVRVIQLCIENKRKKENAFYGDICDVIRKEYGVEFKEIDISKNQEFAANYQVEKTPDLFLLYREKNNEPLMTRFGNGLHTIQDLKDGVLASLYTFKKVPKDILEY